MSRARSARPALLMRWTFSETGAEASGRAGRRVPTISWGDGSSTVDWPVTLTARRLDLAMAVAGSRH